LRERGRKRKERGDISFLLPLPPPPIHFLIEKERKEKRREETSSARCYPSLGASSF